MSRFQGRMYESEKIEPNYACVRARRVTLGPRSQKDLQNTTRHRHSMLFRGGPVAPVLMAEWKTKRLRKRVATRDHAWVSKGTKGNGKGARRGDGPVAQKVGFG